MSTERRQQIAAKQAVIAEVASINQGVKKDSAATSASESLAQTQLKVGDVVMLKSGSPVMTVSEVRQDQSILCVWFMGSDDKRGVFAHDMLEQTQLGEYGAQRPGHY